MPHYDLVIVGAGPAGLAGAVYGASEGLKTVALFIFIGQMPRTAWIAGLIECDGRGFILAGADFKCDGRRPRNWPLDREPYLLETSVPGVFVAGDVRHGSIKRVASITCLGGFSVRSRLTGFCRAMSAALTGRKLRP
jgi:thioredoxin reductase (NADPH)